MIFCCTIFPQYLPVGLGRQTHGKAGHPFSYFSPNKTNFRGPSARLVLNYKSVSYTTSWIEYPDIAPTFLAKDIAPNHPSSAPWKYTVPAICLPNGEHIMESMAIAQRLEIIYPEPSLPLETPHLSVVNRVLDQLSAILYPVYLTSVADLLNPPSKQYFQLDRERSLGKPLEQLAREKRQQEQDGVLYDGVKPHVHTLVDMLSETNTGPFLMGHVVSYADLVLVAWLRFFDRIGILKHFLEVDPGPLKALYDAASAWLGRDDY